MGEKARLRVALGILFLTGAALVWSAVDKTFELPPGLWGLATAAVAYYFSTAKRDGNGMEKK